MIRVECKQGTPQWKAARAGVVTASGISKIVTPGGKPSSQADGYMNRLLAETLLGEPIEDAGSGFMERGLGLEATAAAAYGFAHDVEPEIVGFLLRDDRRLGCSPDRLIGMAGGLEVKCPGAVQHIANLRDHDGFYADHKTQVQTQLLVSGREWWDLMSFHPRLPEVVIRAVPDPAWRKAVEPAVEAFLARFDVELARLRPLVEASRSMNPFA